MQHACQLCCGQVQRRKLTVDGADLRRNSTNAATPHPARRLLAQPTPCPPDPLIHTLSASCCATDASCATSRARAASTSSFTVSRQGRALRIWVGSQGA